jgi:hypothetical protein
VVFEVEDVAAARRYPVRITRIAPDGWGLGYIRMPVGPFRVIARDESASGWLAFRAPKDVGVLTVWAARIMSAWRVALVMGLLSLLVPLLAQSWIARGRRQA